MRRNSKDNPFQVTGYARIIEKNISRQKYAERQIDNWVKWSWNNRGKVMYKELVEQQEKHGIKCYG